MLICITFLLSISLLPRIRAEHFEKVTVGDVVLYQVTRSSFFKSADALASDGIRYAVSQVGYPDPPAWLTFLQRDHLQDGFLYGTPTTTDDSVALEMVAVNVKTQQTSYRLLNITVQPTLEDLDHLRVAEFWVLNYNVEEILKGKHLPTLAKKVARMWQAGEYLRVVSVSSIATLTGHPPPVMQPGTQPKDGVMIQFGSRQPFSAEILKTVEQSEGDLCSQSPDGSTLEVDSDRRFSPEYHINWCKLKLIQDSGVTQHFRVSDRPTLATACQSQVAEHCSKETGPDAQVDSVQQCLKSSLLNKLITTDNAQYCALEVARMILEDKQDIETDGPLYRECTRDIQRYCSDIARQGRETTCLLGALDSQVVLMPGCESILRQRLDMYDLARKIMAMTESPSQSAEAEMSVLAESVPWLPRSAEVPRQDLLVDFFICVVVPLGISVLLFLVLSIIMFGQRQGRSSQEQQISGIQLKQFQSLRQATTSLRQMSHHRDGPPGLTPYLGRSLAGTPATSLHNTLSRSHNLRSYSAEPLAFPEGQQMAAQTSAETLKVRK